MASFFHKLFNPHCPECSLEKRNEVVEVLRELLESEKYEKKQLINHLLGLNKPVEVTEPVKPQEVVNRITPWRVQRELLEKEDRERNRREQEHRLELEEFKKKQQVNGNPPLTTEELEKELGVE